MKALILAGGYGTRLRPLTYGFAKQLIPVANKPVLFYSLEDVKSAGISEVIINVAPHSKDDVMEAVKDGAAFDLNVKYNIQEQPLGIAHAIKIAKPLIGDESFVVYLGDNILKNGIANYVNQFRNSDVDAIALVAKVVNPERFGTVEVNGDKVIRLVEKPRVPTSNLAMVGVYLLRSSFFEFVDKLKPSWRNELEIVEAYQGMVDNGKKVEAIEVDGWWADTGTTDDLIEANRLILDELKPFNMGKVEGNTIVEGRVGIGRDTVILSGTTIRGPAIIGDNCRIGPDAYIGPNTSIGSNVNLSASEIENSIIMDGARINSGKRITDSLIGKDAVIESRKQLPSGLRLILGQKSYVAL